MVIFFIISGIVFKVVWIGFWIGRRSGEVDEIGDIVDGDVYEVGE